MPIVLGNIYANSNTSKVRITLFLCLFTQKNTGSGHIIWEKIEKNLRWNRGILVSHANRSKKIGKRLSYCINFFPIMRQSRKLYFDHLIFVGCGQACSQACSKFSEITYCQYFWEVLSWCLDCFNVVRQPCKVQFDQWISLIGCGEGSPGMPKVFRSNEPLIYLEIVEFRWVELYWIVACSSTSLQLAFWSSCFSRGKGPTLTPKIYCNGVVQVFLENVKYWVKEQSLCKRSIMRVHLCYACFH